MNAKEERGWNLYQRGDGQWVLQWKRAPGDWPEHRVPREHTTERRAEKYALAYLDELRKQLAARPEPPAPRGKGPETIRSLASKWEKLCDKNPKLSPSTRAQHKGAIDVHVLPYPIADVPIEEMGSRTLRERVRTIRDDGRVAVKWETVDGAAVRKLVRGGPLAPNTVGNLVNSLSAFFDDAMAEEWVDLPANPVKHVAVRREVPERVTRA